MFLDFEFEGHGESASKLRLTFLDAFFSPSCPPAFRVFTASVALDGSLLNIMAAPVRPSRSSGTTMVYKQEHPR